MLVLAGRFTIDLPIGEGIPITGQTIAVLLTGVYLNQRHILIVYAMYLIGGSMLNMPFFADGSYGWSKLSHCNNPYYRHAASIASHRYIVSLDVWSPTLPSWWYHKGCIGDSHSYVGIIWHYTSRRLNIHQANHVKIKIYTTARTVAYS